jgi:hypothetical protein
VPRRKIPLLRAALIQILYNKQGKGINYLSTTGELLWLVVHILYPLMLEVQQALEDQGQLRKAKKELNNNSLPNIL